MSVGWVRRDGWDDSKGRGEGTEKTGRPQRYQNPRPARSPPTGSGQPGADPDVRVDAEVFKRLVRQTLFAAACESTKYAFDGILVETRGRQVAIVATDGRRLAVATGPVLWARSYAHQAVRVILREREVRKLPKALPAGQTVSLWTGRNRVMIGAGASSFDLCPIEDPFPPYEGVIPREVDKFLRTTRADFLAALKMAVQEIPSAKQDESKGVFLDLTANGLRLTGPDPTPDNPVVELPGNYEGEDLRIAFNPDFLLDALKVVDAPDVELGFTAANRPMRLTAGPDFLYVLMPVNL